MTGSRSSPLLAVENLTKHYPITEGILGREVGRVRAVDGIDFTVGRGETVGLVGESGCGKSTAATTLLQLEEPTDGTVRFDGDDVTEYTDAEMRRFRRRAQMIFQDPDSSFDPRMSVGESVAEPLVVNGVRDRRRRRDIVETLLVRVGLEASDADRYPHEFSGGQKQRIALARALVVNPDLLVADEPVSALDVSVQAEILTTIDDLQTEFGLGIVLISHNLAVVREICDRVCVMYLGELVETGPTEELFADPQHPYTRALISSIPTPDPHDRRSGVELTGDVPSPSNPPRGCRFHTRCPEVIQPDGIDLDQETWRRVVDFERRVHEATIDVDSLSAAVDGDHDADDRLTAFDDRLRRRFDVPDPIPDPDAERVVRTAIEHVSRGDFEAASDRLESDLGTVCRRDKPASVAVTPAHEAACHLVDRTDELESARENS